ncbi:hypothetical protein C8Q73DRAFT_718137 [Cubamyces lactineus]|nr:hypothetical protein C8Q73DRAFT_718137 [Cubamyces lactineus]
MRLVSVVDCSAVDSRNQRTPRTSRSKLSATRASVRILARRDRLLHETHMIAALRYLIL